MTSQPVGIIDCRANVIAKPESFLGIGRPQILLRQGEQPAKEHSNWRIGPGLVGFQGRGRSIDEGPERRRQGRVVGGILDRRDRVPCHCWRGFGPG